MSATGAALLAVLALTPSARPAWQGASAEDHTKEAPTAEGALDNDVFVPIAEGVLAALTSGDQALARARSAQSSGATAEGGRLLDVTFDTWREALTSGGSGASTWFDLAPGAGRRLAEGVRAALERRLLALSGSERERWTTRLTPAADKALSALHQSVLWQGPTLAEQAAGLGELVRLYPLTAAAARAALELGDLALEEARRAHARAWYARAEREAERSGAEGVAKALAVRTKVLGERGGPAPVEPWERATAADFVGSVAWQDPGRRNQTAGPQAERWLRPGGTFLDEGRFAVQTAGEVLVLALGPSGDLGLSARLRLADLLGGYTPELAFEAPREPPGWPLLPHADEQGLVLVVGRTRAQEPNALLALELEAPRPHQDLGLELTRAQPAARLVWAIVGAERIEPEGTHPVPGLEELADYEFQPGPVASGDLIVVQARQFEGRIRAWLLAFERRAGTLAWKRLLASGADRVATPRFAQTQRRVAGQPLLALEIENEPRVFAGTHLGLGVLVDTLLGEPLWSLKNRRRGEQEPGWSGDRPPLGRTRDGEPLVLWAPMDSDRLYALNPRPLQASDDEAGAVLTRPPAPLIDAQTLLGGDGEEHLVLGSMGRERTLSARRTGLDRVDALDLDQDERFHGLGLVTSLRVWACTNRALYLFDRTRELYLLDHDVLPPSGGGAPGGDLAARGANVLVVGSNAVWSFLAR